MKERLEKMGWVCAKCSCPYSSGWDCMHKDYKGFLIKVRDNFKIQKHGIVIDAGFGYQLNEKLQQHGIFKENI